MAEAVAKSTHSSGPVGMGVATFLKVGGNRTRTNKRDQNTSEVAPRSGLPMPHFRTVLSRWMKKATDTDYPSTCLIDRAFQNFSGSEMGKIAWPDLSVQILDWLTHSVCRFRHIEGAKQLSSSILCDVQRFAPRMMSKL
ncbi:hypothetical protein CEE69_13090 [Rhodopirellula bahusiensis]|uniref:Uncharacterized protein n=1 Tax=Rhodopirellula bahusiensis TaxID=2014065 RepID=A0A2G1W6Y3_9BACT|nr:hypothetical protein CEE69_13090 [Rhodopirellula bahusiensis]